MSHLPIILVLANTFNLSTRLFCVGRMGQNYFRLELVTMILSFDYHIFGAKISYYQRGVHSKRGSSSHTFPLSLRSRFAFESPPTSAKHLIPRCAHSFKKERD